jgi:ankyrin repeat protein
MLMLFSLHGYYAVVQKLLSLGADTSLSDFDRQNVLHYLFSSKSINPQSSSEITALICKQNPGLANRLNENGVTPWILAARCGDVGSLSVMATHLPVGILERGSDHSALNTAAVHGQVSTIRFLVESLGIDVNTGDKANGFTAIHGAAGSSQYDSFKLLIELGANPFRGSMNAIEYALQQSSKSFLSKLLKNDRYSSSVASESTLISLAQNPEASWLFERIVTMSSTRDLAIVDKFGNSLLMLGCGARNCQGVQALLQSGVKADYATPSGETALHVCARVGSQGCSGLVLRFSRDFVSLSHQQDSSLNTALHIACENGDMPFAIHLIRSGCPVDVKTNAAGLFPEDTAAMQNHVELACLVAAFSGRRPSNRRLPESVDRFWNRYFVSAKMDEANATKRSIVICQPFHVDICTDGEQSIAPVLEQFTNVMKSVGIVVPGSFSLV